MMKLTLKVPLGTHIYFTLHHKMETKNS
uniref:Uncharacterized protein n=1 Tax=Rhizophora mucronata TaxID=61149 RepID=A0A2P2NQX3_RHIMU